MIDKNYMKRRFKCRCYHKDNTVKIYDGSEILFDVSYRDFDDAFYLGRKLQSVIMELNELHEENTELHIQNDFLKDENQHMRDLVNENEELKTVINRYEKYSNKKNDELNFRQLDILKLKEENEQLKQLLLQFYTEDEINAELI